MLREILHGRFRQLLTRPRLSRHPRRARRGFSLFETILVVLILGFATQWIITFVTREAHLKAARAESVQVSELARAAETYLRRDLGNIMTEIANLPTRVRQITLDQLRDAGIIMNGQSTFTALRRDATIWAYAPSTNELYVLVRATGGDGAPANIPTAQPGVTNIGWVSPTNPTRVTGPELSWDVSGLQSLVGWPVAEDLLAVIYLNADRDLRPYLHRSAVSGRPELNQMMTDIDMGGGNITNAGDITTGSFTSTGQSQFGTLSVTGAATVSTLSAQTATVSNTLNAGTATINTRITAPNATIGTLTSTTATVSGAVTATSATVTNLDATNATVANQLNATTLRSQTINSTTYSGNTISTNQATVGGSVSATTGQFNTLQTNGCTGC